MRGRTDKARKSGVVACLSRERVGQKLFLTIPQPLSFSLLVLRTEPARFIYTRDRSRCLTQSQGMLALCLPAFGLFIGSFSAQLQPVFYIILAQREILADYTGQYLTKLRLSILHPYRQFPLKLRKLGLLNLTSEVRLLQST